MSEQMSQLAYRLVYLPAPSHHHLIGQIGFFEPAQALKRWARTLAPRLERLMFATGIAPIVGSALISEDVQAPVLQALGPSELAFQPAGEKTRAARQAVER